MKTVPPLDDLPLSSAERRNKRRFKTVEQLWNR